MQEYERLEQQWRDRMCPDHIPVSCSSGTAALHLAFETLRVTEGWHDGDKVFVPDFAMIACARAVTMAGLEPHFVDVDDLGLLDYRALANCNGTVNAKALLVVHTYGRQAETNYAGPLVVEDLAEAHGIRPNPESAAACWSCYKNKVVAGEEGGIVAFKTPEQAEVARRLKNMGFTDEHDFWHTPRATNYRLSNVHAQLICESLAKYDENMRSRRHIESLLDEVCPVTWRLPSRRIPWVYDFEPDNVAAAETTLAGIPTRQAFKPLSQQPEYRRKHGDTFAPTATRLSKTRMYLPIVPEMPLRDFENVLIRLRNAG